MKRFRFKLQTVLDQRKAREERLQVELAEVLREEARESAKLAELLEKLDDAVASVQSALESKLSAGEIAAADEYAKCLRDDVKVQQLTIRAVRSRVEAKRAEVVEAMKERKVLEALRDKQEREHIAAQMRIEQNQLDDVASVRYARGA
jgi:flagellar FliJ protein